MRLRIAAALLALGSAAPAQDTPDAVVPGTVPFEMRVLASGLENPWEITLGPDGALWLTERVGARISRIDTETGAQTVLAEIADVSAPGGQDGLLGLALHPGLLQGTGEDYVYAAYTYVDEALGPDETVTDPDSPYRFLYSKIVRFRFDAATGTLTDPVDVIGGLPAGNDHNSGRLKIGPDEKLYYTLGDLGKNQLGNWCIPIEAQRLPTADELAASNFIAYQGKSLRLDLDGSIPEDNPEISGVRSHVFTFGHRNMQGIDFGPDGTLYASEQGPKSDDEVNILLPGGNYGWPHVAGFRDDMAYQFARWSDAGTPCASIPFSDIEIHPSVPVENETAFEAEIVEPLATLFTVPSDWDFSDPECQGIDFICWPTVAASSIAAYMPETGGIPGWENSLIVPTLKRGSLYRLPLAEDGKSLRGPIERYFQSENRFRDIAFSPDMKTIYVATDPGGLTEALAGGTTTTMQNPGAILVFSFSGEAGAAPEAAAGEAAAPADDAGAQASSGAPPTFTAEQAARGRIAYGSNCVSCHGADLVSTTYGTPLAGPYFEGKWFGRSVGALFRYTHDRMPPSRPGSLPDAAYADILAYVLEANGVEAGEAELPADPEALAGMTIRRPE